MQYGYLIKISNNNIYKEVQLPIDARSLKIGLSMDCDVRFHKELFFENFELLFVNVNGEWQISCSDNVYINIGDVRKLATKRLSHADSFTVNYQNSETELFRIDFVFDFDNEKKDYDRCIDITGAGAVYIGGNSNCNVVLSGDYVQNELVELVNTANGIVLNIKSTVYGVYHNGSLAENGFIINNTDFFSISNYSFYYKNGILRTSKNVFVQGLQYTDDFNKNNYPRFTRSTRINTVIDNQKIGILEPPAKPQKPKNNLLSRLLPSAVMIIMGLAMISVSPFMLVSSAVGVITAVISLIQGKKDFKDNSAERISKYENYIENKKQEIITEREKEKTSLENIYIDISKECDNFQRFSSELFDRIRENEDFLTVRMGSGKLEAQKVIDYKKQERLEVEDDLQKIPQQVSEEYKYIDCAPIVCSFKDSNAIGIVGYEQYRFEMMKNIVIDICARQFQSDVKLFFVVDKENTDKVFWLRMLPHVQNSDIGIRNIICDDESKNLLFEYLYRELNERKQNKSNPYNIVVFLYDEYGFHNHPVSKFVNDAKDLGVTFVYFGDDKSQIGLGCDYIIEIKDSQNATLIDSSNINKSTDFVYPTVSDYQACQIAGLLAPVYTEEISLEGTLTKSISLFKLLNIFAVDDIDLQNNWASTDVTKSMSAPLGVSKSSVVYLDLHDKAHGPHGLVAGTTGSGKSEILQTYILSMSILFHPYEVGFLIIDFKGGGMVNQFRDLPHLIGAITNIDGKEIDRSLKSIKAELQKRQKYFAQADVNHINKYIKKYKAGEVKEPLPHLIIIVDEFAELKADQPEFMKELISAARIGRSLGVHLILATQKPSGQVNEQIWSNSRFKLCLKVQDQSDSNEVLKSPLAAEIKEPGRAYLQVGNNEIFELFQSAYSGAPEKADSDNIKEFKINYLDFSGRKKTLFEQKKNKSGEGNQTQLDAIVNYVHSYCENNSISKLPDICLPSLAAVIDFPEEENLVKSENSIVAEIGVYDDPDNQYQGTYSVDLTNQNVMIIGSAQSGKTNVLQTMIRTLATKYTPEEVNIYIIDFASMVLKNFEALNHVGGVVTSSEDEKLKNLLKLLFSEIEVRKEKLMSVGVSSYSAYKEAGKTDLPQIVLMIDNLTALKELYFEDDDELLRLCREGLTVGVSIVIANAQTSGIGYRYLSNFSSKIALFCNDSSEYNSLFDYCSCKISNLPGRCIVEIDKYYYECQSYLSFNGEKEFERVENIKTFVNNQNIINSTYAKMIPLIPAVISRSYVEKSLMKYRQDNNDVIFGIDYSSVSPMVLNFSKNCGPLVVSGRDNSGKSNFIKYIITTLDNMYSKMVEFYIFDNIDKKLSAVNNIENLKKYEILPDGIIDTVLEIENELKARYAELAMGNSDIIKESPLIMLVINNRDALELLGSDKTAYESFKQILKRYKNLNVSVIVGDFENIQISFSSPDIYKYLRDFKNVVFFDDLMNFKIFDLSLSIVKQYKKPIEIGDAYYIKEHSVDKVKTVLLT